MAKRGRPKKVKSRKEYPVTQLPIELIAKLKKNPYFKVRLDSYEDIHFQASELIKALDDTWVDIMNKFDPDSSNAYHLMKEYHEDSEFHKLRLAILENQIRFDDSIPF